MVKTFDEQNDVVFAYVKRFGPLPDFRRMDPETVSQATELMQGALDRDQPVDWGLDRDQPVDWGLDPEEPPTDAAI